MQAIILAAGMGKRLKQYTKNNTKCMVKVDNETLIERMLSQLDKYNLSNIIIVVGYKKNELIDYISKLNIKTPIEYISNDLYEETNNIYSLSLAKDKLLNDDTVLLESDIIFEDSVLDAVINDTNHSIVLVDKFKNWMEGSCVTLDNNSVIKSFVSKADFDFNHINEYFKTVNIYKFSKEFSATRYVPYMEKYLKNFGKNIYYEEVLSAISRLKNPGIVAKNIDGMKWYEIDDEQDLDIAKSIFAIEDIKLQEFNCRYGGYWRFNNVLDYCYLVNPYYPSSRLLSDINSISDSLMTNYPSGGAVLSKLASSNFNILPNQIVVGNGAAELIHCLINHLDGSFGIINPTFEEYKNRIKNEIIYLETEKLDFKYNEDTIIDFYSDNRVDNIVLINPDNPSGNYISIDGLLKLLKWTKDKNIRLILDESFVDFTSFDNDSLFDLKTLSEYPNLILIKSISKSHGIPGLRLGLLASSDLNLVNIIKEDLPIWNINSFGEYYLQIMHKYNREFNEAIVMFRNERERFYNELTKISNIKVYESEANYFMIEILNNLSSHELTEKLLNNNVYIKDLSPKINNKNRNLIRIAIRNTEDNDRLLCVLKQYLN